MTFNFLNSYADLGSDFGARVLPTPVKSPSWISFNETLAQELGLAEFDLKNPDLLEIFSGNRCLENSSYFSMVYAGHQFGNFVPRLGDGRAILLGEVVDRFGKRRDVQLKGAGLTPYSRQGDGRSALGPVLREYLVSEAMNALGVPSTRALAAVQTGEVVHREEALPGAIFCRVASSHLRVGSFEYFAHQQNWAALETLISYAIKRHFADDESDGTLAERLLHQVCLKQSELVASWMSLGFIHGVMNTDNTSISGETIDFGPCAFMEEFRSDQVFSFIDRHGRYAFENQPAIAQWNMQCLGIALSHFLSKNQAQAHEIIQREFELFQENFLKHWWSKMAKKFGFFSCDKKVQALMMSFLSEIEKSGLDFTKSFRDLLDVNPEEERFASFSKEWVESWWALLRAQKEDLSQSLNLMKTVNPVYIPRNHLIEEVIQEAQTQNSFGRFHELLKVIEKPFEKREGLERYERPAAAHEKVHQTFCGT